VHHGPLLDLIVLDCRSFRTANDGGVGTKMLGDVQARWLVDMLASSRARWKIIACDQPLGLVITDGPANDRFEGFANTPGAPSGREVELAAVLRELAARGVSNLVWLTADVHYTAAHRYDPSRAAVGDFAPFWEFVAGPIHAGTFGPNALDPTFGPSLEFQWAPPPGKENLAPWDGLQSFGTIDVAREALVVALWGIDGKQRYKVELPFG
jgi:alkaline phosphatase D